MGTQNITLFNISQRAYSNNHDIAIRIYCKICVDRAGLVGADGPTHAGSFDLAYLSILPNFVVMAASNEIELARMVKTAADNSDQYPLDILGVMFLD